MVMKSNDLPDGWFSPGDIAAYVNLYEQLPAGSCVAELGVWQGRSLCSVADVILRKKLKIHAVDTFRGTPGELDIVHDCDGDLRQRFESNLTRFGIANHAVIHVGSTECIAQQISAGSLNLVFIDADHSYETVLADIKAWMPKVKVGGVLCGHDYNPPGQDHAGVRQAVDELIGMQKIIVFPESSIWAHRI
jgi:cephalosporin hydroxylase